MRQSLAPQGVVQPLCSKPSFSTELLTINRGRHLVPAMDTYRLGLHLGASVNADCRCDGRRYRHVQAEGDMTFVPPGLPGSWEDDAACRILRIHLSPTMINKAATDLGVDVAHLSLAPRLHFRHRAIEHISRALLDLTPVNTAGIGGIDGMDQVMASTRDALGHSLVLALIQTSDVNVPPPAQAAGGLTERQKHRLSAYIDAHLDHSLSLGELAQLLSVSISHFTALFRQSYHMSPHQYVLQRRLDRAVSLLTRSDLSISEIALITGFSHQSHLASVMRRHRDVSPRQLRQQSGIV